MLNVIERKLSLILVYIVDKEFLKNPNLETEFFDFDGAEVMEDWWDWGEDVKWGHGYRMF